MDELLPDVDAGPRAAGGGASGGVRIHSRSRADVIWSTRRRRARAGVMLNSPTNPTGAVYELDELRAILALAASRGWWVISDEIYREISYESPAPSLLDAAAGEPALRERLVVVDGVAKAYAMTGWRIGWSIAPRAVAKAMRALQSHTTSNASTLSQHAALCALIVARSVGGCNCGHGRRVPSPTRRRGGDTARGPASISSSRGARSTFSCEYPHRATAIAEPGTTFARELLDRRDVAIVPGAAFRTPEWVRISYAAPMEDVLEGVRRVVDLLLTGDRIADAWLTRSALGATTARRPSAVHMKSSSMRTPHMPGM